MISRYSRPEMASLWDDKARFSIWLEIELFALEAMANEGLVPKEAVKEVRAKGRFEIDRVLEIEKEVKHDVIAFLTNVAEHAGEPARFLHRGMTSSDVLDTCLAVQLKRSGELILSGVQKAKEAVKARAIEHKLTPCIGRSHGIHAEPISFGVKLIGWYAELGRQEQRLKAAIKDISFGKISGAVGTYASVSPKVEQFVMEKLGLAPETVSTQIVPRDRHATFFACLSGIASSLERFCVEIRHLQRTEVREVEEAFGSGQKGSSAMPHKKNPVLSENLSGLARLVRGYAVSASENVALWHERDISHSSVERVIGPDACIVLDFMLHRFIGLVQGLIVHTDRLQENLEGTRGIPFSGTLLIALADSGISREEAYSLVQKHALAAWEGGATLQERVSSDPTILKQLGKDKIKEIFDIKRHLKHIDLIFERALKA